MFHFHYPDIDLQIGLLKFRSMHQFVINVVQMLKNDMKEYGINLSFTFSRRFQDFLKFLIVNPSRPVHLRKLYWNKN